MEVFGEQELLASLKAGGQHYSHCISIRDPDEQMPDLIKKSFKAILELRFYDAEDVTYLGPARGSVRVPERRDVRGVIEFFNLTRDRATGYTLHCWHGQSRSPAIALGLLYLMTGSAAESAALLKEARPGARPHRRIVRLFDDVLGSNLTRVNEKLRRDVLEGLKAELEALVHPDRSGLPRGKGPRGLLAKAIRRRGEQRG